jgi:hypothetical protein
MYAVSLKASLQGSKVKPYKFIVDVDDIISAISIVTKLANQYGEEVFHIYEVNKAEKLDYQHVVGVDEFDSTKSYYRAVNSSITAEGKVVSEALLIYCGDNEVIDIAKEYLADNSLYEGVGAIPQTNQLSVAEFVKANAVDLYFIKQYTVEADE